MLNGVMPVDLAGGHQRASSWRCCSALIEQQRPDQEDQQHDRDRGGHRPVLVGEEFQPQRLPDHHGVGACEQIGDDEFADDRNEAEQRAGAHPRQRQRKRHLPERLPRRGAEIGGSFEQRRILLCQRRKQRQDHERQIGIDDTDIHRGVGGEPHQRRRDQMQFQQHRVEQAVVLQDVDPGIDADQERGPERHDDEHHRDRLPALRQPRHAIGDGVADQEQHRGRDQRHQQAAQIGQDVEIVRDQQLEIIRRKLLDRRFGRFATAPEIEHRRIGRLRDRGLRQRDLQHEAERHQEEQHHPEIGRDRGIARRASEDVARAHCSSTRQSSDVNQATTRWLGE